jgi:uncharacterized protein
MRVGILGASGFIGRHVRVALTKRGDDVLTASLRDPAAAASALAGCDVVVNLAGEPIAQRWTASVKRRLYSSRVEATRAFIDGLRVASRRPSAYVSSSAIGYYEPSEDATYTEASPHGDDFLGELCAAWEREAERASDLGMRVAVIRNGIVLGNDGGALAKMLPAFRAGLGGPVSSGRQWMSWIHLADCANIYLRAIDGTSGVFNATAPQPVTNAAFARALAAALHRPAKLRVPALALRALLGEGAGVLLTGQRVLPERTLASGFTFAFPSLTAAFEDLL